MMTQIASGDVGTPMAVLYRRYSKRLFRYGLQALGDAGLAEELVQECFVRLWRYAGKYDASRGSVAAYVSAIARSCIADIRRRPSSRRLEPEDTGGDPEQPDRSEQILDTLVLREALGDLSDVHQHVLRLVYENGLTQTQIAERLGKTALAQ